MNCYMLANGYRADALTVVLFGVVVLLAIGIAHRHLYPIVQDAVARAKQGSDGVHLDNMHALRVAHWMVVGLLSLIGGCCMTETGAVVNPAADLPPWCFSEYQESREAVFDVLHETLGKSTSDGK